MTQSLWIVSIAALVSYGLFGQSSAMPSFEVASVKPTPAGTFHRRPVIDPERFSRNGVTVKDLVSWAYSLEYFQIAGGPAWFTSEHYDIQARAGSPANCRLEPLTLVANPLGGVMVDDTTSTVTAALEKQLGLKLESRKQPMPVIVIDHVDRVPAEN
jgi:hypothetical protein